MQVCTNASGNTALIASGTRTSRLDPLRPTGNFRFDGLLVRRGFDASVGDDADAQRFLALDEFRLLERMP